MSKKPNKKRQRIDDIPENDVQSERDRIYQKPFLARLYDKMNPGDYTMKQDFHHVLFLFSFIVIVVVLVCLIWTGTTRNYEKERESQLVIPSTAFVKGQETVIYDMLDGYGFKDIQIGRNGEIIAYGTADMVQAYKDSYKEKNVDKLIASLGDDRTEYGIESIALSDDARILTIRTYRDLSQNTDDFSEFIEKGDVNKLISTFSTWCGLRNNGGDMTTVFVNVFDTSDDTNGTQYYSSTRPNGDQMLADMEKEKEEAAGTTESENTENTEDGPASSDNIE